MATIFKREKKHRKRLKLLNLVLRIIIGAAVRKKGMKRFSQVTSNKSYIKRDFTIEKQSPLYGIHHLLKVYSLHDWLRSFK